MCGHEFDERQAGAACRACPMSRGCGLIRCPNCGFESPRMPGWLQRLLSRLSARKSNVAGREGGVE
jgi:hypothetical protein